MSKDFSDTPEPRKQPEKWELFEQTEARYYSANDIAIILKISRHLVYKLAKKKVLPNAILLEGIWRFPIKDFEQMLANTHEETRERIFNI